jgi:hypothetical protein
VQQHVGDAAYGARRLVQAQALLEKGGGALQVALGPLLRTDPAQHGRAAAGIALRPTQIEARPKQSLLARQVSVAARDVRQCVECHGAVARLAELPPVGQAFFSQWRGALVVALQELQPGGRGQRARLQRRQVRGGLAFEWRLHERLQPVAAFPHVAALFKEGRQRSRQPQTQLNVARGLRPG